MPQPRIMFYHDGRHPLIYMYEPPMQKEEYEAGVDELIGTPVEALMFCLGDGRTVLHDTQVGELWGHNMKKWPHLIFHRAHRNAVALIRQGHDPLRIICDRAHQRGLLVYPTLLVQQGGGERGEDTRCSDFWFDNPHLSIGGRGDLPAGHPGARCMDFKHEEVRAERFALIQETLDNYDIDGFELQLNYGLHYFHPDEVKAGRQIMTGWVRQVYRALKKSGRQRELAIRVPASIPGCLGMGLDVRTWIKEGIVDVLIGQTYSGPELQDQMADFRPLVKAARGSKCRIHAALQSHVDSDRLHEANIQMVRAAACNYWDQGVDGLYLAHWFNNWPYGASFYEKLRELPYPEIMAPKDKQYYVVTPTGRYTDLESMVEPGVSVQLPANLEAKKPVEIKFTVSDDLSRWHKAGRVHEVLLRVRTTETTERDRWRFRLNGKELPDTLQRTINRMYMMNSPRYRVGGYWFVFRLDQAHWPRKGENKLEVTLLRRDPEALPPVHLRDVELETKYLMGKKYHRGQDPDLGEYEYANE